MARQKYKASKRKLTEVAAHRAEATLPATKIEQERPNGRLILFDLKVKVYLVALLGLYFFLSLLKIHSSSTGNWDILSGKPEAETVIAGTPRWIRLDEWMVATPAVIGQYNAGMPLNNPA